MVGLDIGSSAVKAVELRRVSSGYRVVAMRSEPLPPDSIVDGAIIDGGVVSDIIRQLFDRNGIKTVTVVSGGTPTATFRFSPSTPNLGDTVFLNATASTAPRCLTGSTSPGPTR